MANVTPPYVAEAAAMQTPFDSPPQPPVAPSRSRASRLYSRLRTGISEASSAASTFSNAVVSAFARLSPYADSPKSPAEMTSVMPDTPLVFVPFSPTRDPTELTPAAARTAAKSTLRKKAARSRPDRSSDAPRGEFGEEDEADYCAICLLPCDHLMFASLPHLTSSHLTSYVHGL